MRSAPGVPLAVRAAPAAAVVVLSTAVVVVLWSDRDLWLRASAAIPLLSTWGFAAALTLLAALVVVVPVLRPTRSELGLAPRQLLAALGVGAAVWTAYHLVQLADIACYGRAPVGDTDVAGDLLGAYAEELIYRVVTLGAIATVLRPRMPEHRATAVAIVGSTLVFWLAHFPHDLVTGDIGDPTRVAVRVGEGVLMAAVYLSSGNVMIAVVLHALVNGPMLVVAGPHHVVTTSATNWIASVAVVLWYRRNTGRTGRAVHGAASARSNVAMRRAP